MKFRHASFFVFSMAMGCGGVGEGPQADEDLDRTGEELIAGQRLVVGATNSTNGATFSAASNLDWAHWGRNTLTDFNRKSDGGLLRSYTRIGSSQLGWIGGSPMAFAWTGGTPTASATDIRSHIRTCGLNNGFQITAPAAAKARKLRLYSAAINSRVKLVAQIDGQVRTAELKNLTGQQFGYFDIEFARSTATQELSLQLTVAEAPQGLNSCVSLIAQTLDDIGNASSIQLKVNPDPRHRPEQPQWVEGEAVTLEATVADPNGIRGVEFYRNATLIGTVTTPPYKLPYQLLPGLNDFRAEVTTNASTSRFSNQVLANAWASSFDPGGATIPDNDPNGLVLPLRPHSTGLTQGKTVKEVWAWVLLHHPWDGDLALELQAPNGNSVSLSYRNGGDGDNYSITTFADSATRPIQEGSAPFNGLFKPQSPLSVLKGQLYDGKWKIIYRDLAADDVGMSINHGIYVRVD